MEVKGLWMKYMFFALVLSLNMLTRDALPLKSTRSPNVHELMQSVPMCTMYFKGSDQHWKGEYQVINQGKHKRTQLHLYRMFKGSNTGTFKYIIETPKGPIMGEKALTEGNKYTVEELLFFEKDTAIKVVIEWEHKRSTLILTNRITDDVILPEKALQNFMDAFENIKDISKIDFSDFRGKKWYVSYWESNGLGGSSCTVPIDALTGEVGHPMCTQ
ncbi:hypothetical protein HZI73_24340 [Vallitalea pronyensis]|uniref:Uncharacterized protein n=1 Tax=Vallitalea pronyensis TaxID=1348613 RepID=A0A8J8MNU0_9FIRM|nr:hypothetical protein [Vallitalea pronyensis]QUI25235.1 hypothetical protein HZI73_24340 [Vallitalea pronyensis]